LLPNNCDMSASAFNNHWRRFAMTGGGAAPKSFAKDEDLRKFISATPDASVDTLAVALQKSNEVAAC
jgi:hypothetical protein